MFVLQSLSATGSSTLIQRGLDKSFNT